MSGATLYSKWVLASAEAGGIEIEETWDELGELYRACWNQLAQNLELDYKF